MSHYPPPGTPTPEPWPWYPPLPHPDWMPTYPSDTDHEWPRPGPPVRRFATWHTDAIAPEPAPKPAGEAMRPEDV